MQIKTFIIPAADTGVFTEELNRFLRSHKILEVSQQLISNETGANWCFCVKYLEQVPIGTVSTMQRAGKIDYKDVLDAATFKVFSRLREIRKSIAAEDGVPVYAVFVDEELAELAKLPEVTPKTMLGIKGIGDKKIEKFAARLIKQMQDKDETTG
jgi:superfamily II DNA helicase RecQ